jgi:ATP-dependent RNA helicase RhlE
VGYRVQALQGNMTQNRRQDAIDGFRGKKYDILVATDVASRGIDVAEIAHVINFDMPDTPDAYTHRVGRTGRAEHEGEALTLAQPEDEIMVRQIEKVLGEPLERRRLDGFNYEGFDPLSRPKGGGSSKPAPRPDRDRPSAPGRRPRNIGRGRSQR